MRSTTAAKPRKLAFVHDPDAKRIRCSDTEPQLLSVNWQRTRQSLFGK